MTNADGVFVNKICNGDNIHQAYKEVYMTDISKATDLIKNNEEIRDTIVERLKDVGITEHKIHKTLKKQLDAKKVIYYDPKLSKDVVDDNDAQLNAVKVGYRLLGLLKENTIIDNRQVTFSGDPMTLLKIVQEMKAIDDKPIDITGEVV